MRSPSPASRGAVTAEWAIALPAVILTASVLFGAMGIVLERTRLDQAAADAVRILGLGGSTAEAIAVAENTLGTSLEARVRVDMGHSVVCVELSRSAGTGTPITAMGRACGLVVEEPR